MKSKKKHKIDRRRNGWEWGRKGVRNEGAWKEDNG